MRSNKIITISPNYLNWLFYLSYHEFRSQQPGIYWSKKQGLYFQPLVTTFPLPRALKFLFVNPKGYGRATFALRLSNNQLHPHNGMISGKKW